MATNYAQSQVSIDDLLEYTSLNGDVSPEEQAAEEEELPHIAPVLPSPLTPEGPATPLPYYLGQHPNASLSAVPKSSLSSQSCHRYMALPLPTPAMLAAAHVPEVSELIPQDHPEWQKLRSGKVTGSSLAEFLGLFEESAGAALSSVGVYKAMRDPAKLKRKVLSLQQEAYTTSEVDAITQVFFDWGHQHEPNGILRSDKIHHTLFYQPALLVIWQLWLSVLQGATVILAVWACCFIANTDCHSIHVSYIQ